jgi:hypothetical protein
MTYVHSLPVYIYDMYWEHFLINSYFTSTFLNDITYYLASSVRRARKHDLEFHPVFPDRLKVWLVLWMEKSRSNVGSRILYNEWEFISLPQGRNHWRRLVRVPEKAGNFLTSWETIGFSRTPSPVPFVELVTDIVSAVYQSCAAPWKVGYISCAISQILRGVFPCWIHALTLLCNLIFHEQMVTSYVEYFGLHILCTY